jgi:hypothetical protein
MNLKQLPTTCKVQAPSCWSQSVEIDPVYKMKVVTGANTPQEFNLFRNLYRRLDVSEGRRSL